MRNFLLAFIIGALFLSLVFAVAPATAGFAFEDPQLCVNGKLLTIHPSESTAVDVTAVHVPADAVIGLPSSCDPNGDDSLAIDPSVVVYDSKPHRMVVQVLTDPPHSKVRAEYDHQVFKKGSNSKGVVFFKFKLDD